MPNDQTDYTLELGDTLRKLELLSRGYKNEAKALEEVVTKSVRYNNAGQEISRTIQATTTNHKILTATLKKQDNAYSVASESIRDNTRALKENDRAKEALSRSRFGDTARRFTQEVRPNIAASGASQNETFGLNQAQERIRKFAEAHKVHGRDIRRIWSELARGQINSYTGKLHEMQARLISLRKAQSNLGTETNKLWQAEKRRLDTSARQTKQTLRQAKANIDALAKQHLGTERVNKAVKKQNAEVHSLLLSWKSIGRLVAINLLHQQIFALTQQVREAVRSFVTLEIALAEIQTLTRQISHDQASTLIFDLSDQFGLSAIDQANAAYEALSNQIGNTESELRQFMTTVNEFALVTKSTAQDGSDLISAVMNSYSLSVAEADRISQALFATIDLGRLRAEDLANSIGRVLVPAKQLGLAYEEVFAALTLMTQQGIKADVAQTLLRNVMLKMAKPTAAMNEAFNQMGVSSGVAAIETFGLMGTMQQLFNVSGSGLDDIADLFKDIRAIGGAAIFAGDNLEKYNSTLEQITNSTEAWDRALKITTENVGIKFRKAVEQTKNFFTQDVAGPVVNYIHDITNGFEDIVVVIKVTTQAITALLIPAVTALIVRIGTSIATFASLHPVIFGVTAAIGVLSLAIVALHDVSKREERQALASIEREMTARRLATEERVESERKLSNSLQAIIKDRARVTLQEFAKQASIHQDNIDGITERYESLEENIKQISESMTKSLSDEVKKVQREYDKLVDNISRNRDRLLGLQTSRSDALFQNSVSDLDSDDKLTAINRRIEDLSDEAQSIVSSALDTGSLESIELLNRQQDQVDNLIDRIKSLNDERAGLLGDDSKAIREDQINQVFDLELSLISKLAEKQKEADDNTLKLRLRNIAIEEQARAHFAFLSSFNASDINSLEDTDSLRQSRDDFASARDFINRNLGDSDGKDLSTLREASDSGISLIDERLAKLETQNIADETRKLLDETIKVEQAISDSVKKMEESITSQKDLVSQIQRTLIESGVDRSSGAKPLVDGLFAIRPEDQIFNRLIDFTTEMRELSRAGILEGIDLEDVFRIEHSQSFDVRRERQVQNINDTQLDELRSEIALVSGTIARGVDFTTHDGARDAVLRSLNEIEKFIPAVGLDGDKVTKALEGSNIDDDLKNLITQFASLRQILEILNEGGKEKIANDLSVANEATVLRRKLIESTEGSERLDTESLEEIKRSLETVKDRFELGDRNDQQSSTVVGDINIELASSGNENFDAAILAEAIYREIESGTARPFPTGANV